MFSHAPLLLCPIFLKGKCVSVGPSRRNSKVTVREAEKKAERSCIHTHAHLSLCPGMLGGQRQQMVCIGSYCLTMQQQGARCPVQPWPEDTILMSCISVTVNLFPVIKASPSGSSWQQRVAGGHIESSRWLRTFIHYVLCLTPFYLIISQSQFCQCVQFVQCVQCWNACVPLYDCAFSYTLFNWPSFSWKF